jgi:hypothetical protein
VRASELVELIGTSADGQFPSGLSTSVREGATGTGGNLTVETGRLIVRDGAAVIAQTYGFGAGGSLTVRASELVELSGTSAMVSLPALYLLQSGKEPRGLRQFDSETQRLIVRDIAAVLAETLWLRGGGSLTVRASELVELSGTQRMASFLAAYILQSGRSHGGCGQFDSGNSALNCLGWSLSINGYLWSGGGGNLAVRASESVELSGTSADGQFPSGLSTSVRKEPRALEAT